MFYFLVSSPVDAPPVCLENNRPKPGSKARLYCGQCRRDRCLFRPTMTPAEYKMWQLGRHDPLPVEDVPSFVLEVLSDWGEATTEQLRGLVRLSASHFWKHLNALREKGLIVSCGTGNGRELAWRLKMDEYWQGEPEWFVEFMEWAWRKDNSVLSPIFEEVPVCWSGEDPFIWLGEPVFEECVVAVV